MRNPISLFKASLAEGRDMVRYYLGNVLPNSSKDSDQVIVPVRSLGENYRTRIAVHLLSLHPSDRYLRFGHAVQDDQIRKYAEGLDFQRDEIFGIFDRRLKLLAVAHLAYAQGSDGEPTAEFGVSVDARARGRGWGARLFEHAAMHAVNRNIRVLYIHALSENSAMLAIARKAGAEVRRDGSETDAYLQLPPATFTSQFTEIVEEQVAQADYRIKTQVRQLRSLLAGFKTVQRRWDARQKPTSH